MKHLTFSYSLIHAFFWMSYAASNSYTSIYLLDAGFTNTQIGTLIASVGLLSAFLQPVVASYADRPSSPSLKRIVLTCCLFFIGMAAALILSNRTIAIVTIVCYGSLVMLNLLFIPLVNALGMQSLNQGKNLNFGLARGIGSVAYAVAAYVIGLLVSLSGSSVAPVCAALLSLCMMAAVQYFPFEKTQSQAESDKNKPTEPDAKNSFISSLQYFFSHYRSFCFVLLGYVCSCTCHMMLNNFTFQIIVTKGGGSAQAGTAMSIAAMAELPTMFLFTYMLKKLHAGTWFKIASVFFVIKSIGSLLAPNVPMFYAVQLLQMFAWALNTVSSVYYVNSVMDKQDAVKGQAYMSMAFTLGNVLSALAGGVLIDHAGIHTTIMFATVMGIIGMILVWIHIPTKKAAKAFPFY